jgi:hypothetical protein
MAEHSALPAREHSGHPVPLCGQPRVTDCVHPSVKRVEPAGTDTRSHLGLGKAEGIELANRHRAVLPRRQSREPVADLLDAFVTHPSANASSTPISPRT